MKARNIRPTSRTSPDLLSAVERGMEQGGDSVFWLRGPFGSGKTYLARHIAALSGSVRAEGTRGIFFGLRNPVRRRPKSPQLYGEIAVVVQTGEWRGARGTWVAANEERRSDELERLAEVAREWASGGDIQLEHELASGLVIVVDDYDLWCEVRGSWAPPGLCKSADEGAVVVLTGEARAGEVLERWGHNWLLEESGTIKMLLPSEDDAAGIARDVWRELQTCELPSGAAYDLARFAGRYPTLVVALARASYRAAQDRWGRGLEMKLYTNKLPHVFEEAWRDEEVQEIAGRILDPLSSGERLLLSMHAVAQMGGCGVAQVLANYKKRIETDERDFEYEAKNLKEVRLLIAEGAPGEEGYVPALCLYSVIRKWKPFARLIRELGIALPGEQPGPIRAVLSVVLLASLVYVLAVFRGWDVMYVALGGVVALLLVMLYYLWFVLRDRSKRLW